MSVIIRILLYIVAGNLMRGGWIPEDVANQLSTDEELIRLIEMALSGILTAGTIFWWRIAKRLGWST